MKVHSAAIRLTTSSGVNIDAIAITAHGRYSAFSAYCSWAPSFGGVWRLLKPPQRLHRFAEADATARMIPAPTVDRPQLGRNLQTAAYLARNSKFESIPLQRRVRSEPPSGRNDGFSVRRFVDRTGNQ
jgi:hypothetical protein